MSVFSGEFIIKQIALLRRFKGKVILRKIDDEDLHVYTLRNEAKNVKLLSSLIHLVQEGKINEAENFLFDALENERSKESFASAILFYQKLSFLTTDELKDYNFTLLEVAEGFKELCEIYEIEEIL